MTSSVQRTVFPSGYNTYRGRSPSQRASPAHRTDSDTPIITVPLATPTCAEPGLHTSTTHTTPQTTKMTTSSTAFQPFPLSNFKYFLTLFSKFFSSFPHGTCSLSVSRQYLALDETYHPFRAAIPNNSTLGTRIVRGELQNKDGILTLSDAFFQRTYSWVTR
jgi:hypothetical protein